MRSRRVVMPCSKACWISASSAAWDWAAISAAVRFLVLDLDLDFLNRPILFSSLLDICGCEL